MGEHTVIENCSPTKTIEITLGQTEGQSIALPEGKTIIKPNEKAKIPKSFDCGCGKLFAWFKGEILWQGIVPLCGSTPIKVDPDLKKVSVLDGEIPPCGDNIIEGFEGVKETGLSFGWILMILLLLIFILYWFLRSKK